MKNSSKSFRMSLAAIVFTAFTGSAMAATTTYSVQNLMSNYGYGALRAISPTGQVVGFVEVDFFDTPRAAAVLWESDGSSYELIDAIETISQAFDINANGQVLVYADGRDLNGFPSTIAEGVYIWQSGTLTPLNLNVSLDPNSLSLKFNDAAQVIGTGSFATSSGTQKHAFIATNGVVRNLGTLPGGNTSAAYGINNNGDVVGLSNNANNQTHAVLWRNGNVIDLGTLSGATESIANDINDLGVVVGSSGGHIFTWKDGFMTDQGSFSVDTSSSAKAISNNGDIVGNANVVGTNKFYSFKLSQGMFSPLDPVIKNGQCRAGDINGNGQIILNCTYSNDLISPTADAVDLGVLSSIAHTPVAGDPLTFSLDVYNVGSRDASNVQFTNPLPTNSSFSSVTTTQGSCSGTAVITCALGNMASGSKARVDVTVVPLTVGSVSNSTTVASNESESNTLNNSVAQAVYAFSGGTDLGVSMTSSATTISRNSNVTFTITVVNNGPGLANNSVMTDALPNFLSLVSVSTTSGTCNGSNTITCNLGTTYKGDTATITIVAKGIRKGSSVNTAKVSTTSTDKVSFNNSFGYSITVK